MGKRRWVWSLAALLVAAGAPWGRIQEARGEEKTNLGVLDMNRLFGEYQEYQRANREFQEYQQELVNRYQARINQRKEHYLLTRDEWEELETLLLKGGDLDDAEKERLKELQAITPQLREELNMLQTKPELTEEEQNRKRELTHKHNAGIQELDELNKEFDRLIKEKLRERDNRVSTELRKKIDAMIIRVAQENGLDMVFNKDSVLYGGRDITEQVVQRLNEENPVPEKEGEGGGEGKP